MADTESEGRIWLLPKGVSGVGKEKRYTRAPKLRDLGRLHRRVGPRQVQVRGRIAQDTPTLVISAICVRDAGCSVLDHCDFAATTYADG